MGGELRPSHYVATLFFPEWALGPRVPRFVRLLRFEVFLKQVATRKRHAINSVPMAGRTSVIVVCVRRANAFGRALECEVFETGSPSPQRFRRVVGRAGIRSSHGNRPQVSGGKAGRFAGSSLRARDISIRENQGTFLVGGDTVRRPALCYPATSAKLFERSGRGAAWISALAWGARGHRFKSGRPDYFSLPRHSSWGGIAAGLVLVLDRHRQVWRKPATLLRPPAHSLRAPVVFIRRMKFPATPL